MPACKHTHTHLRVELYVYIYIHTYTHTYICISISTSTYTCIWMPVCVHGIQATVCIHCERQSRNSHAYLPAHMSMCLYMCGRRIHVCIACTTTTIQKPEETGMYTIMPRYIHKDVLQIQRSSFRANVFKRERARNVIVMLTPPFSDG